MGQILGTNDLVGVEYLTRGVRAAAAVGRVLIRDESDNTSGYASGERQGSDKENSLRENALTRKDGVHACNAESWVL